MTEFMVKWSIQVPNGTIGTEIDRLADAKTGITAIRLLFPDQEIYWFLSTQLKEITE